MVWDVEIALEYTLWRAWLAAERLDSSFECGRTDE